MTEHRITVDSEEDRAYWECDCGRSGSCAEYRVDLKSDEHIDYDAGDRRIDVSRGSYRL